MLQRCHKGGVGYLWSQVPSRSGYVHGVGMVRGGSPPPGHGPQGAGMSWGRGWVPIPLTPSGGYHTYGRQAGGYTFYWNAFLFMYVST